MVPAPQDRSNITHSVVSAFPVHLRGAGTDLSKVVPEARLAPSEPFEVDVHGEIVAIPGRIYNAEPVATSVRHLTGSQQEMLHCWYTRHHDGRVRQRHLERIVGSRTP